MDQNGSTSSDDIISAGKKILDEIQQAGKTGDFSGLNDRIQTRMKSVTSSASGNVKKRYNRVGSGGFQSIGTTRRPRSFFLRKTIDRSKYKKEHYWAVGLFIFGGILILGSFNPFQLVTILLGAASLCFGFFFRQKASEGQRLADTYYMYGERLGTAEYFDISVLASSIGVPEKQVRDNISAMIRLGWLPQARFTASGDIVALSERAYQFCSSKEHPASSSAGAKERDTSAEESGDMPEEVRDILKTGNAFIAHTREVNDVIPDTEEMSDKLYRLENTTRRIFQYVEQHPESAGELKKLMSYYLPATEKLMDTYADLYRQPDAGENIRSTKQDILAAFDSVNDAYDKLLDELFQNVAWDISTDIKVMKTMMRQDGLTDDTGMHPETLNIKPAAQKEKEYADR